MPDNFFLFAADCTARLHSYTASTRPALVAYAIATTGETPTLLPVHHYRAQRVPPRCSHIGD
jgi:hypothetical protein